MSNTTITEMATKTGLSPETIKSALIAGRLKGAKVDGRWEFTMEAFFEAALSGRFMPKGKFDERIQIAQNVITQAGADDEWKDKWIAFAKLLTNDTIQRVKAEQKPVTHRLPSYHTTIRELATCLGFSVGAVSRWVKKGLVKKVGAVMSDKKYLDLFGRHIHNRTALLSLDSFFKAVEEGKIQFIGKGKRDENWREELSTALQQTAKLDINNAERWLSLPDVIERVRQTTKKAIVEARRKRKEEAKRKRAQAMEAARQAKLKAKVEAKVIKALTDAANRDPNNATRWQQIIADINGESR